MRRLLLIALILLGSSPRVVLAQRTVRDSALALFEQGKLREAAPLLERTIATNPSDIVAHERLGFSLLTLSAALADPAARKQQRVRARGLFAKAVSLGSDSEQVKAVLEVIPEDGGPDVSFSDSPAVDAAMRRAESAYGSGDYRTAFLEYQKALALDSMNYNAAVFSGDTYLHTQPVDSAFFWYARATRIDPDRETAWRYWSGVLLKQSRPAEAMEKAIEAIVAEPYGRISRQALIGWAQGTQTRVALPRVVLPYPDTTTTHPAGWVAYDSVRRSWQGADGGRSKAFAAAYPAETRYRHSLAEERDALRAAAKAGPTDPATRNLVALDQAGMLEAYIFFARADEGIASEYETFRATHRDVLRRFWAEFVVGAKYEQ